MSHRLADHLRSNVVAYVALFFATGVGTAWALDDDSVKSRHIKDGSVRTDDVADDSGAHALTGEDIAEDALGAADVDESTLSGIDASTVNGETVCGDSILRAVGSSTTLCQRGSLTLRGDCEANNDPRATVSLDTSADDAFFTVRDGASAADLDAADPVVTVLSVEDGTANATGAVFGPAIFDISGAPPNAPHMVGNVSARVFKTANASGSCEFVYSVTG